MLDAVKCIFCDNGYVDVWQNDSVQDIPCPHCNAKGYLCEGYQPMKDPSRHAENALDDAITAVEKAYPDERI